MADLELLKSFLLESSEILGRAEADLAALAAAPHDEARVHALFRGIHTIKGNSSFLDLHQITKLSHAAETLLDKARRGELAPGPGLPTLLARVLAELRRMIDEQETELDISHTVRVIERFLAGDEESLRLLSTEAMPGTEPGAGPATAGAPAKVATGNFTRVDDAKIARILSVASELELLRYGLEQLPERLGAHGPALAELREELDAQVSKLSRLSRSLNSLVFGVRLVPVNQVFQRFRKVIEELGRKLGKEIKLQVQNGGAELDKYIVEAIAEPMTHLIRNAADHGIEPAAERRAAGKPARGTVRLHSYVRANFVYIEIADDGRGIDGARVLEKAVAKGIVPAAKAPTLSESQRLALIFAPGFSTAEQVTDISGRGVGMDVVKSHINRLKGTVLLQSKVGEGTVIQLRFPMSVAVLYSLFLQVGETPCAVPVEQVDESLDFFPGELLPAVPPAEDPAEYLALYSVRSLLWGEEAPAARDGQSFHALRLKGCPHAAFLVEEFSSIEEAVVQSVDSYIAGLPGLMGATVRKDGSVALLLNPEAITELVARARPLAFVRRPVRSEEEALPDFLALLGEGA